VSDSSIGLKSEDTLKSPNVSPREIGQ